MPLEALGQARQYRFDAGPNYTDSLLSLAETELAQTANMFLDEGLRTIPGAARLVSIPLAGDGVVTGLFQFSLSSGSQYFIAATSAGRLAYQNGDVWVYLSETLSSTANTFWDWAVFDDTLIATSGNNAVKALTSTLILGDLAGSPPQARFVTVHGTDFVFLAGHTSSSPSEIRYSDTGTATTWPVGNTLNIGIDDGQIITGLQRFGDSTVVFKERAIYIVSGSTPADFTINPTLSEVGCIAPNSIVPTDVGIFFWSEAGPAIFNGFKTILLNRRMRRLLNDVDWDSPLKITAGYYPYRKQILVGYQRTGQTTPDRMLLIDLYRLGDDKVPAVFWPIEFGATAMVGAEDSVGRKRLYFGHTTGHVTAWDSGTTFNGATITGRARSKPFNQGRFDKQMGSRILDFWFGGTTTRLSVKTSVNGGTFTAHGWSPITLTGDSTSATLCHKRLPGDGTGAVNRGNLIQIEVANVGSTGFALHGWEVGIEPLSKGPASA